MRGRRMKFIKSPHQKHWLTENNKSSLRGSWFALRNCFACVNRPTALAVSSTGNVSRRRAELCFLGFYPHRFLLFCSPQSEMKALSIWKIWGIDTKTEGRHCCPSQGRSVLTFVVILGSLAKSSEGLSNSVTFCLLPFCQGGHNISWASYSQHGCWTAVENSHTPRVGPWPCSSW